MEKVNVNGIQLAYERRGTRDTPLVLLHGFPLDHHLWDEVVPLLEDTFDVILPDLRGFGESTTVDSLYSMDDYASDIAGLLDQLGIQKAAIVGSFDGRIRCPGVCPAVSRACARAGVGLLAGAGGCSRAQRRSLQIGGRCVRQTELAVWSKP